MNKNDNINVRNVYIELLNKLKQVEGVDIHYIDQLVSLLEQDIGLIEIDVNNILDLIPSSAAEDNKLATMNDLPAAQVNSDWNAVSGVAEILNKPTIPAAQVNSDWNATSGVAQIFNKPTIPDVHVYTSYIKYDIHGWGSYSGHYEYDTDIPKIDLNYKPVIALTENENESDISDTAKAFYSHIYKASFTQDGNNTEMRLYSDVDQYTIMGSDSMSLCIYYVPAST